MKNAYCQAHLDHSKLCAITSCGLIVEPGFRTCTNEDHRKIDLYNAQQGKAMFQLKRRLERLKINQTANSLPTDSPPEPLDEEIHLGDDIFCNDKPDSGNRKTKARFGRCWTHNEELCVGSCGVILGRATFVGSEAPNGVRVCPGSLWQMIFYLFILML